LSTEQPADTSNQMEQPSPPSHEPTRRPHKKLLTLVVAAAAVVLVVLGVGYWFFLRSDGKKPVAQGLSQQSTARQATPPPADPTPVTYKSTKLNVELTHRQDWTLKESSAGEVTVTSPQISYATPTGESTTGVFTVKIRKGVTDAMKANIEKAVAPRASEVIAYAAPTEQQRQYTNLSYAGQKESFGFFIVTGNAALKVGDSFAYALPLDGDFYLVAGGYGADRYDSLTFDQVPKGSIDSDAEAEAVKIVESLKIF